MSQYSSSSMFGGARRGPDAGETDAHGETMSKSEAIRRALAAGIESPSKGASYVSREFGIEVTPQHFSATKAQQKKRQEKEGGVPATRRGRKPGQAADRGVEGYLAPPPKPRPEGEGDLLAALDAMKPLVATLGKEQVHRIVDLLG